MSRYIQILINQGEHQRLDFKYEISDARKIARTLSAFSNTDGGKLLIGVKDNGNIVGIRSDEEYHMIEGAAQLYCKPEVFFAVKKWDIKNKSILEVDIPEIREKPVFALSEDNKWMAYIRRKDQNLLANKVMLNVWKHEKAQKGKYLKYNEEEKILLTYLQQHSHITLSQFCRIAKISRNKAENILAILIAFQILDIEFTEKQTSFVLKKEITL